MSITSYTCTQTHIHTVGHITHNKEATHSNSDCHGVPYSDSDSEIEDGVHSLHPHLVEQPTVEIVLQEGKLLADLQDFPHT